jgi:hypothetical protein
MSVRRRLGAVFVFASMTAGIVSLTSGEAFAQSAGACSCLVAVPTSGGAIGQLTRIQGDVQMSQAGGYEGLKADAPVYPGARIMTGLQSSASLSVGANCALDIPANVTVKIDPAEGGMCVSIDTAEARIVPASSGPDLVPILLAGGAVGGAAALILSLHDDDNAVSR